MLLPWKSPTQNHNMYKMEAECCYCRGWVLIPHSYLVSQTMRTHKFPTLNDLQSSFWSTPLWNCKLHLLVMCSPRHRDCSAVNISRWGSDGFWQNHLYIFKVLLNGRQLSVYSCAKNSLSPKHPPREAREKEELGSGTPQNTGSRAKVSSAEDSMLHTLPLSKPALVHTSHSPTIFRES